MADAPVPLKKRSKVNFFPSRLLASGGKKAGKEEQPTHQCRIEARRLLVELAYMCGRRYPRSTERSQS
jgi:hypothetical protein